MNMRECGDECDVRDSWEKRFERVVWMNAFASPLVSVIVPVYNVEQYLNKCIESILKQSYPNIEVLLIDDGSFDKSPVICDEWAKVDSRIKVYHQINKGVSCARNVGLLNMTGEFFSCVDPDDYLDENYILELVSMQKESSADIVFCGLIKVDEKGTELGHLSAKREIVSPERKDEVVWGGNGYFAGSVCKLTRTSIVKQNALQYMPGLKNGEDWLFLRDCLYFAQSIACVGKDLYFYVQRSDSASSNFKNKFPETLLQLWRVVSGEEKEDVFLPWENKKIEIAMNLLVMAHIYRYTVFEEYKDLVQYIKNRRHIFLRLSKMRFGRKMVFFVKLYFYKQYAFLKRIKR